jgi:hypothetical protein
MIWAKRRFEYAAYAPYQDLFEKLLMANPTLYRQFIMVCTDTDDPGVSDYYIGVPYKAFLAGFDSFEIVGEDQLPKVIDTLCVADATTEEFTSRFRFADHYERQNLRQKRRMQRRRENASGT